MVERMNEKQNEGMEIVKIDSDFIRLDSLLKLGGGVVTGGQAKYPIQDGEVMVNGQVCTMRGKKMRDGDMAEYQGIKYLVRTR